VMVKANEAKATEHMRAISQMIYSYVSIVNEQQLVPASEQ
jgi:hypothetical protein